RRPPPKSQPRCPWSTVQEKCSCRSEDFSHPGQDAQDSHHGQVLSAVLYFRPAISSFRAGRCRP
ncbi:hypothetical protein pipiens_000513, partial [Culex pipiens pipiens]